MEWEKQDQHIQHVQNWLKSISKDFWRGRGGGIEQVSDFFQVQVVTLLVPQKNFTTGNFETTNSAINSITLALLSIKRSRLTEAIVVKPKRRYSTKLSKFNYTITIVKIVKIQLCN